MKIVADENIPMVDRFFGEFGEISLYPGREIEARHVKDADILLLRSVTKVDKTLLEGSRVKFVGSCTIGTDHVDHDYLASRNIRFINAPGSNANSVVEYILSCLSVLTETHILRWDKISVGIVGLGNVGTRLAERLACLGIEYKAYDPLIEQDKPCLCSLDEVLACDVITLHVPLTYEGDYPTFHMVDTQMLEKLSEQQILINASRGGVVDSQALKQFLQSHPLFTVILDVWEGEPNIDPELAERVFLGTPHIAGYSYDGKVRGTEMVYRALCQYMGLPARHRAEQFLEEPPLAKMAFTSNAEPDWAIHTAIRACYDVRHDASLLRASLRLPEEERVHAFDLFRKNYRCRREFSGVKIQLKQTGKDSLSKFKALGFNVKS